MPIGMGTFIAGDMDNVKRQGVASWLWVVIIAVFVILAPTALGQTPSGAVDKMRARNAQKGDTSLPSPPRPHTLSEDYEPITGGQRVRWALIDPFLPEHLAGGLFSAAFGTAVNHPKEYGPGWGGFADRFGMRLPGIVTSNVMEASAGAIWSEDPRYFRAPEEPFGSRMKNIIKQTFHARHRDGSFAPAYARYIAYTGSNFLANEWLPASEANAQDAVIRTGEGFLGRMAGNAFCEFWPDVKQRLHHKH